MKDQYIFISSSAGDRSSVLASCMKCFNIKEFVSMINSNDYGLEGGRSYYAKAWRFGKINSGEYINNIKRMSLDVFEELELNKLLTKDAISEYFRSEINKKYGQKLENKKTTLIKKKDMVVGKAYMSESYPLKVYFLGRVKINIEGYLHNRFAYIKIPNSKELNVENILREFFIYGYNNLNSWLRNAIDGRSVKSYLYGGLNLRRSLKPLLFELNEIKDLEMVEECSFEKIFESGMNLNIKFLDVNKKNR